MKSTKQIISLNQNGYIFGCVCKETNIIGKGRTPSDASADYDKQIQMQSLVTKRKPSPFFDSLITDGYA